MYIILGLKVLCEQLSRCPWKFLIGDETEELIQDEGTTVVEPFEETENFLNPAVVRNVQREASNAVAFLKTRQVFWSQYKPLYSKS